MSSKLTDKKLKELISEVLQEDNYTMDDLFSKQRIKKNKVLQKNVPELDFDQSLSAAFKGIAAVDPPHKTFSDSDLDVILNNLEDPQIMNTNTMRKLIAIRYATKNQVVKDKITKILDEFDKLVKKRAEDRQSFSQPQIRTATAETGKFTDEMEPLLNRIFGTKNPKIHTRVKTLSKISAKFFKAAEGDKNAINAIKKLDAKDFLAQVMLMDYFAEISKSFDAGSGAYLFEWMLALLAGGKVTGKQTGPGGGMGAVDFEWTGGKGSAKYYATKSDIKQAATGFETGQNVYYVVALKKQGREQIGKTSRGTSDPNKITMIDIYTPTIKKIDDTNFKINGKPIPQLGSAKSKVPIGDHLGQKKATIYIAQVPTKSFRNMAYKAVSSDLLKMKNELLANFERFFIQLEEADKSCRKYTVTGNVDDANSTFTAIDAARNEFADLEPRVMPDAPVSENKKKSKKDLDKLIEAVILETLRKK